MKSVDVYDTIRNQWIPGPPMSFVLIAVGGFDEATGIANAGLLDPRTGDWSELASMTTRRSSVGVTSVGSSVYAVGGYDGHSRHCLNTVEVFDLRANRWRAGKPLREFDLELQDTVEIYNPGVDDDWALIPNMSAPRRNAGVKHEVEETRGERRQCIPAIEPLPEAIEVLEHEHMAMVEHMNEDTLFVMASGLGPTSLPPPKVIKAEVLASDREALYLQGGVQFITSRILMVDFLTNRVPAKMVAAILVYRAHQLLNSFQETFILRLYREKNPEGHVKGFTDMPMYFAGIGQLQRLVDRLFVRKVHLLPRHDTSVVKTFARAPPSSIEITVDLSGGTRRCISLITDLLKVCLRELKQSSVRNKKQEEEESDSFNAGVYFTTELEKRLQYKGSFLPDRQRRLLSDLKFLRNLLRTAENLDACTVLYKLNELGNDKEALEESTGWSFTPTGARLKAIAQELASFASNRPEFVAPPKWTSLESVLDEIKELHIPKEKIPNNEPRVLVFTSNEQAQLQVSVLKRLVRPTTTEAPIKPIWNPDQVSSFFADEANPGSSTRKEVIENIQKQQKEAARVAKKRKKVAESLIAVKQKNLEHFGVIRYKKLTETREKVTFIEY
ncbi:unnamed protein product, partial [Mesorhabditis belari]|uniref:Uncharacterized protein n=1 Tax=Mesorhabditis belari TaxID=2138241 RepID=A0AAF3ELN3_9BILA